MVGIEETRITNTDPLSIWKRARILPCTSVLEYSFFLHPLAAEHPLRDLFRRISCQRVDSCACFLLLRCFLTFLPVFSTRFRLSSWCFLNVFSDLDDLVHAYGHVRCFRETSFSTMVLHPPGREVHACARHGPYYFGGLRSFISNLLLLKSGATTALVFHKPQNIKGTPCHNVMPLYGRCQWVYIQCLREQTSLAFIHAKSLTALQCSAISLP